MIYLCLFLILFVMIYLNVVDEISENIMLALMFFVYVLALYILSVIVSSLI